MDMARNFVHLVITNKCINQPFLIKIWESVEIFNHASAVPSPDKSVGNLLVAEFFFHVAG